MFCLKICAFLDMPPLDAGYILSVFSLLVLESRLNWFALDFLLE